MAGVQPTSLISDHLNSLSFFNLQSNFRNPSFSALPFSVRAFDSAQRQKHRLNPADDSTRRIRVVDPPDKMQKLNLAVSTHRAVAAVRLMRIELGGAYADLLNDKEKDSLKSEMSYVERTLGFRTKDLENRDFRLVTDIVGGTIRWKRYLDYLILSLCRDERTFTTMEPLLLQILRIGCYELVKLEMPPHAVVNENVNLAKIALRPGAGNMVNGILRKLVSLKESNTIPVPSIDGDDRAQARALATIHSHPVVLAILEELPDGTKKKLAKKGFFHQEGYILRYLPVPPNCLSIPDISDGVSVISNDVASTMLKKVLRQIETIKSTRSD